MCYWVVVLWYTNVLVQPCLSNVFYVAVKLNLILGKWTTTGRTCQSSTQDRCWSMPASEKRHERHVRVPPLCYDVTKLELSLLVPNSDALSDMPNVPTVISSASCDPRSTSLGNIMTLQRGLAEPGDDGGAVSSLTRRVILPMQKDLMKSW